MSDAIVKKLRVFANMYSEKEQHTNFLHQTADRIESLESRLALAEELHKQADHFLKYRDNAVALGNALKAFEQSGEGQG